MAEIDVKKLRELAKRLRDTQADCADSTEAADAILALCDRLEAAEKALREIAEQNPIEMALDPTWAKRIATATLAQRQGDAK